MLHLFAHLDRPIPEYLQELLNFSKKSALEKFAKEIQITKRDFVTLVWNAVSIGYFHDLKSREFRPPKAELGEADWDGFRNSKGGKLTPEAIRTVRKSNQIFHQRRLVTAHIFYNLQRWHIFYFDQRDMEATAQNHWKHGSHIHFVNDLWPNYTPLNVWDLFELPETNIKGKLHIRYDPQEPETSSDSFLFP